MLVLSSFSGARLLWFYRDGCYEELGWAFVSQLLSAAALQPHDHDREKLDQNMTLHFLRNVSVTCNDGSPAGSVITVNKTVVISLTLNYFFFFQGISVWCR